jgi:hypothetical protein
LGPTPKRELHALNPELRRRVPDTTMLEPVRSIANYSYQSYRFTGKGFICVGDAHRFIDPIYSFGLCVSFAEAKAATDAVKDYLNGEGRDDGRPFAAYELERERGIDVVEDTMDAFWEYPFYFAKIVHDYRDEMMDIFAARLWERQPNAALIKLRGLLKRERVYDGKLTSSRASGNLGRGGARLDDPDLGRILREFALTRDRRDRRLGRRRQRRHWLVPAGGHFGISFSHVFAAATGSPNFRFGGVDPHALVCRPSSRRFSCCALFRSRVTSAYPSWPWSSLSHSRRAVAHRSSASLQSLAASFSAFQKHHAFVEAWREQV